LQKRGGTTKEEGKRCSIEKIGLWKNLTEVLFGGKLPGS